MRRNRYVRSAGGGVMSIGSRPLEGSIGSDLAGFRLSRLSIQGYFLNFCIDMWRQKRILGLSI